MNASPWQCEVVGSLKALHKLVDSSQLTADLDGSFPYSHSDWICFRRVRYNSQPLHLPVSWDFSLCRCFYSHLNRHPYPECRAHHNCHSQAAGEPLCGRLGSTAKVQFWAGRVLLSGAPVDTNGVSVVSYLSHHDRSWSPSPQIARMPLYSYKIQSTP